MNHRTIKSIAIIGTAFSIVLAGFFVWLPSKSTCACEEAVSHSSVLLTSAVNEYFSVRKQAVLAGDATILWNRYPDLKQGMDLKTGVNSESILINSFAPLKPVDGTVNLEHYAPHKVQITRDTAEVIVHGLETYLLANHIESGGEITISLHMRKEKGKWTLSKTDEETLEEIHRHKKRSK